MVRIYESEDLDRLEIALRNKAQKILSKYLKSEECGYDDDEIADYSTVETRYFPNRDVLKIEVRTDLLSYDGLMTLCDLLNSVVEHFDTWFEPETSGIVSTFIYNWKKKYDL